MKVRFIWLMVLLPSLALSEAFAQSSEDLLLVGTTLIDGSGAEPNENAWIRVSGDRIAAMGQGAPPSTSNARVLELKGKTVIPGLADMHVHLGRLSSARWMMKLFLAHGITTVKDAGNSLGHIAAIRRWMEEDDFVEKCGMNPVEAIHTSTGRASHALEITDRGTIEVGKVADMVIVGGNLAEDIGLLARIENVILAGRVLEVEQLLKEAAKWAAEDRPEEDEATH